VDEFIARENIRRFGEQLQNCTDERLKVTLQQLLAEHEQRLTDIERRRCAEGGVLTSSH
jgi:hypothetical protein